MFAMTGGSLRHNRATTNMLAALDAAVETDDCRLYAADAKLRIGDNAYYPDAMVVCTDEAPSEQFETSPCLVAEVLSPPTRTVDLREKLDSYRRLPSLQAYLVIDTDRLTVECHVLGDGWPDGDALQGRRPGRPDLPVHHPALGPGVPPVPRAPLTTACTSGVFSGCGAVVRRRRHRRDDRDLHRRVDRGGVVIRPTVRGRCAGVDGLRRAAGRPARSTGCERPNWRTRWPNWSPGAQTKPASAVSYASHAISTCSHRWWNIRSNTPGGARLHLTVGTGAATPVPRPVATPVGNPVGNPVATGQGSSCRASLRSMLSARRGPAPGLDHGHTAMQIPQP